MSQSELKVAVMTPTFFALSVNVAEPPEVTFCDPPETCRSDGLLEVPEIETVPFETAVTVMVVVLSRCNVTAA